MNEENNFPEEECFSEEERDFIDRAYDELERKVQCGELSDLSEVADIVTGIREEAIRRRDMRKGLPDAIRKPN